jgi:spore germination protein YaaH
VASITGDEVAEGRGKPHPDPYLLGAEACGADPEDCIAIEDSPTGIRSALAAGCHVVGVPNMKALDDAPRLTIIETLEGLRPDDLAEIIAAPPEGPRRPRSELTIARRPALLGVLAVLLVAVVWWSARDSGEPAPPPLPPGAVPIDVWAPYWTLADSLPETDIRLDDVREVSPFWFGARGVTTIVVDENADADATDDFVERVQSSRALLVPSIRDEMPAGGMARVLADPANRSRHVQTIVDFADRLDADGIDLDYEQFAFSDGRETWAATRPTWVAFVIELAAALHADDRTLTVSIPPVWGLPADSTIDTPIDQAEGYWVYDHGAIAEHVDAIRIMAYDYSVETAGPIAPLSWVADAVASTSAIVPAEYHDKLVLGVGSYGRNWVASASGDCPASAEGQTNVFARSVLELADRRSGTPTFDPVTSEWSFEYALTVDDGTTSCVQHRQVHWVDADGAAARTEIARRAGWGGVALWALGYEDDEVWQSLVTSSRTPLEGEPAA